VVDLSNMGPRRAREGKASDEDGFTLIELLVATSVLLIAMVSMLYTFYAGFRGIATAKVRQSANGLANKTMEQIRALPFDAVKRGLDNTDLANTAGTSDTAITVTGSGSSAVYKYGGEQIPRGDNAAAVPLVPHRQTVALNNVTYTISSYVTYYQNQTTANTFRATVVVTFRANGSGGPGQVQVQTLLFSPSGSAAGWTATHPFAAPTQPFFYGSASNSPGQVNLTGTINGIGVDHAALWLPGQTSRMQIEQVQAVQGTAQTAGATLQLTGNNEQSTGRQSVSSGADTDPSQPKPGYQSATASSQSSASLSASGNNNSLAVNLGAGDTAGSTSTIDARASTDASSPPKYGPCLVASPASTFDQTQTDQLPCGDSKSQQAGALSMVLGIKAGPNTVTTPLASVGASTVTSGAFTNRDTTSETVPGGTVCGATSGDGCIQSLQYRSIGTVSLGALPIGTGQLLPGLDLPGYDPTKGLVQLSGFSDSVSAEAGIGAGKPKATISAGTVSYFNGLTYSTMSLTGSSGSTPTVIPIGLSGNGIHVSDSLLLGALLQLDVTANLTTGGTSVTDPAGCSSTCTRTQASAASNSPIVGSFNFTLTYSGNVLANVTTNVDLGSLLAKSSYSAAPT
jgi:prepilin-type N-terminal cleavage/methylation domain-containing protein